MIVDAQWMGHSVSEIVGTFGIPQSMVLRLHQEYLRESITAHHGHAVSDQRYLARIDYSNRHDTDSNHIQIECKKYQMHIQQTISSFFSFHGIEEQKTCQGTPVNSIKLNTALHLGL